MALDDDTAVLLPCGRDPVDVWDRADDDADGHEDTCAYCQEVRREHAALARATRSYLDEPIDAPDALLRQVMATVRAGIRARDPLELAGPRGPIRIDPGTAETILRWSLDQLDDVHVRTCTIVPLGTRPVTVVNVEVGVETRVGSPIPVLVGRVRAMVRTMSLQTLSIPAERVDVAVTDLFGGPVVTDVHVGATVTARIAAHSAAAVGGVAHLRRPLARTLATAVTGRLASPDRDGSDPGTGGVRVEVTGPREAEVEVALAVTFGRSCVDVAVDVQDAVAGRLRTLAGVEATVAVDVVDVEWDHTDGPGDTGAPGDTDGPGDTGAPGRAAAGPVDGAGPTDGGDREAGDGDGDGAPTEAHGTSSPSPAVTPDRAPTRAEAGRRLVAALEATGDVTVWAGAVDLPDFPGLPPRGVTVAEDRVVVHLRLLRLPVDDVVSGVVGAVAGALDGTVWADATVELRLDEVAPEALTASG